MIAGIALLLCVIGVLLLPATFLDGRFKHSVSATCQIFGYVCYLHHLPWHICSRSCSHLHVFRKSDYNLPGLYRNCYYISYPTVAIKLASLDKLIHDTCGLLTRPAITTILISMF